MRDATGPDGRAARAPGELSVALVYPPYGPFGVASLGLSILSASVKARGIPCKTFYWNIDFLESIPFRDRKPIYLNLSCQFLFPDDCTAADGEPQGDGTQCMTFDCPASVACCFDDGSCEDLFRDDCTDGGGVPQVC